MDVRKEIAARLPLPQELVDEILGHLAHFHSDKKALGTCSLVCHAWLHVCRSLLFKQLNICRTTVMAPISIIDLINSPLSTIPSHVSKLELENSMLASSGKWEVFDVMAYLPALPKFPRLATLEVDLPWNASSKTSWGRPGTTESSAFLTLFGDIRHLRLKGWFDTTGSILGILSSLPKLETLIIEGAAWLNRDHPGSSFPLQQAPSLRHVSLGRCPKDSILSWLSTYSHAIHSVQLERIWAREAPVVCDFLRTTGPSLESLEIDFTSFEGAWDLDGDDYYGITAAKLLEHLDLNHNPKLLSLNLRGLYLENDLENDKYRPWSTSTEDLITILSQISPETAMEKICFSIVLTDPLDLSSRDWRNMVRLLERSQFGTLELLWFDLKISWTEADATSDIVGGTTKIRESFSEWDSRKILRITHRSFWDEDPA